MMALASLFRCPCQGGPEESRAYYVASSPARLEFHGGLGDRSINELLAHELRDVFLRYADRRRKWRNIHFPSFRSTDRSLS